MNAELIAAVAQAIAAELARQDSGDEWALPDDLKVPWLDQGEVDFGLVARAALAASAPAEPVAWVPLNFEQKSAINATFARLYEKGRYEGLHGHFETMFNAMHEAYSDHFSSAPPALVQPKD